MELLLALAVITAVIIFGALISLGNERQRRAIDELREQVVLWAIQDLRIKREHLARDIQVKDPLGWLNRIATKACGYKLELQVVEAFEEPCALVCVAEDKKGEIIFTPLSPSEIRKLRKVKMNRLLQGSMQNHLLFLPKNAIAYEISSLNSSKAFDQEMPYVWNILTKQNILQMNQIWMYAFTRKTYS